MIADHLTTRIATWGNDRRTVQVWRRWDGMYRVVELHRIGESSRYREVRGETCSTYEAAEARATEWRGPESTMADRCVCRHEEREHQGGTREEAAGWLYALVGNVDGLHSNTHAMVRLLARDARANRNIGDHESAAACYLAARILRAVRP